jgi:hypothetical protein
MPDDLREAEQLLAELIRAVEGVERTLAREPAESGLGAALDALIVSDDRLPAVKRLEVYAHAYFFRLHDALAEDFGTLAAALGEGYFHDLITAYLRAYPSATPSIRFVGARLARFISAHSDGAWVRARFPFAASLAELEWAVLAAFDAPDAPPARRDDYAAIDPERFADLILVLDPSVMLLDLSHKILALREAHDGEAPVEAAAAVAKRECVLLWRRHERVSYRPLDPLELAALRAARAGRTFGELCALAAASLGEAEGPARAAGWLGRWLADGCLAGEPVLQAGPPDESA